MTTPNSHRAERPAQRPAQRRARHHAPAVLMTLAALLFTGCGGTQREIVYIVLSPTPNSEETVVAAAQSTILPAITQDVMAITQEVMPTTQEAMPPTAPVVPEAVTAETTPESVAAVPTLTPAAEVTPLIEMGAADGLAVPPTELPPAATATFTPVTTPLPPGFPTPVMAEIQVAEQLFEHGRMFWLQPTGQIWVLTITGEGHGDWTVYPDEFIDTAPTLAPTFTAVAGLIVPDRGFGKLWREVPAIREQLGYAVTPEFGYVSRYAYYAGGTIDASGAYIAGSGYHILYSLYDEQFRFDEADGTWRLGS